MDDREFLRLSSMGVFQATRFVTWVISVLLGSSSLDI
jgi:hypothetical protein